MIKKFLPNAFTLGNLFLGMMAIVMAINEQYSVATVMIIVAMLLDGLDGFAARALNAHSPLGKELDALSDMVSFGVAPTLMMYMMYFLDTPSLLGGIASVCFSICGAIRLARFNVRPGVPGYFIGLPIPAAGSLLATLSLFSHHNNRTYIIIVTFVLSYMMVSSLKYPNLKKTGVSPKVLGVAFLVACVSVIIAVVFPKPLFQFIFIMLLIYALYGLIQSFRKIIFHHRVKKRRRYKEKDTDML